MKKIKTQKCCTHKKKIQNKNSQQTRRYLGKIELFATKVGQSDVANLFSIDRNKENVRFSRFKRLQTSEKNDEKISLATCQERPTTNAANTLSTIENIDSNNRIV
jgi:hypothetical protein